MSLYFVTYDLRKKQEHDYQKLYDELEKFGAVRVLESTWCFRRDDTDAGKLRDHFGKLMHKDDGLLISRAGGWATRGVLASPNALG